MAKGDALTNERKGGRERERGRGFQVKRVDPLERNRGTQFMCIAICNFMSMRAYEHPKSLSYTIWL